MPVQRAINDLIETRVSWIVKPLMESDLYPDVPLFVNCRSSSAASCLSLGVLFYLQQAQTRTVSTERRGRFRKLWVGSSFCPQAGGYLWCPPRMTTDRVPSGRDRKSRRRRRSSFSIVMSMSRSCEKKSHNGLWRKMREKGNTDLSLGFSYFGTSWSQTDLRSDGRVALLAFCRSLMRIHGVGSGYCHGNPRS